MGVLDRSVIGELMVTIIIEMNWFLIIDLSTILTPSSFGHNDSRYCNDVDYETTTS